VAALVFTLGLYVVLKVSGLTRLAVSLLGGAGLFGLVIGFAFRDIAENFLASMLIGLQHPFASGDLIEVAGHKGFVQSVNTRSTLLMTLEGNHVQIPNATIYKGTITNFTANPFARFDFVVGIGYDDSISGAQQVAMRVLQDHPAILHDPEPLVLVDTLGASTVNLRVYFWMDVLKHSPLKVQSAIIRLTKGAFDAAGVSMPDEAREVVFPAGVPVRMVTDAEAPDPGLVAAPTPAEGPPAGASVEPAQEAEGDLGSEAADIGRQAQNARSPEGGPDLLGQD
jgi:small-conductance mechanosensitive channel